MARHYMSEERLNLERNLVGGFLGCCGQEPELAGDALALAAALLTGLAISAVLRQRTPRPERLTAQPTSREMVELVRTLRGKS